jgi:hypothetical protein
MKTQWPATRGEWEFETERLRGVLVADGSGQPTLCNHRLRALIHKASGILVSPDQAQGRMPEFGFSVFRTYARDAWLTELRATQPVVTPVEQGVRLTWAATIRHAAKVDATFTIREPNAIDLDLRVEGYAYYPDFEILIANYLAPGFANGVYVAGRDAPEQIRVADHPAFHGMYPFFPRDEHAAHVLADGRGQRGRWPWHTAIGRKYGLPATFFSNGTVDALLMGCREDVQAVGVTYSGDEAKDGVADHRAQYLSLFGRDLHPGEGWRTQVRFVVDDFGGDSGRHLHEFERFQSETGSVARSFELTP